MATIESYAIIGDGRSAALIDCAGSIDWLCWPRFDSPPLFARLLDDRGGAWRLAPTAPARVTRRYLGHTNVLATRFATADGCVVVTDAMTVETEADKRRRLVPDHELVRCVACESGEIEMTCVLDPEPDFGRQRSHPQDSGALGLRWHVGRSLVTLRADVPIGLDDRGTARATFRLRAGERATFALAFDADAPAVLPIVGDAAREAIDRSIKWWEGWIARARYGGPHRDAVLRSALVLKLLEFAPSGAIVAAPTTSLPERPGGTLNWDYRYCWLRDASFTARALLELGYEDEASAFGTWLLHTTRLTRPELHVAYDVFGNDPPGERSVPVHGFGGAQPVHVGNAAFAQRQLDTYGEVIDASAQLARAVGPPDRETAKLLRELGDYACSHWCLADSGIWEPREPMRHRTHSRLSCWVALDRMLDLADRGLLSHVPRDEYARARAAIRRDIEDRAFDPARGCYTGALGGSDLDAAVLMMSYYGFHDASSPRMRGTYARIREHLGAAPGLFYRYDRSFRDREGAFWICSFWAVDHLARGGGTPAEARALFSDACSYANDVGLMAEEIDPNTGSQLGNFPQAYTHVGVIGAAVTLEKYAAAKQEAA